MKKAAFLLPILFASVCSAAFAEDQPMDPQGGARQHRSDRTGGKGMEMMGMMKGGMHSQSMVASNDGGVFVLSGGKLMKYDSMLNLVQEIELKGDSKPKRPWKEMSDAPGPPPDDAPAPPESPAQN